MVITVTCPSCSSSFPVDPAKIPEGGVKARCTQCNDVFRIEKPADPAPEPVMELPTIPAAAPAVEAAPVAVEPPPLAEVPAVEEPGHLSAPFEEAAPALDPTPAFSSPAPTSDPFTEAAPFEAGSEALAAPSEVEPPPVEEAPAADGSAPVLGFTFGKRDPTDKAKRLARVLVSDMIMYNAERHQSALEAGTLVQDFEEEIQKSWKEYIDQVGEDMASGEGRQFWTEALNDILAKGQDVF